MSPSTYSAPTTAMRCAFLVRFMVDTNRLPLVVIAVVSAEELLLVKLASCRHCAHDWMNNLGLSTCSITCVCVIFG